MTTATARTTRRTTRPIRPVCTHGVFNQSTPWAGVNLFTTNQPLQDAPNVLADLALESGASTALSIRLASAFDHKNKSEHEAIMARLPTPVAQFRGGKRGSVFAQEAMECLGGNGSVKEGGGGVMARTCREMPRNSIWVCDSRLGRDRGYSFGTLGAVADLGTLLDRALPT